MIFSQCLQVGMSHALVFPADETHCCCRPSTHRTESLSTMWDGVVEPVIKVLINFFQKVAGCGTESCGLDCR